MENAAALSLENLSVSFDTPEGEVHAVRAVTLAVARGECLGIVGESGAGKSQLFLAIMGLLAANGRVSGSARLGGTELIGLTSASLTCTCSSNAPARRRASPRLRPRWRRNTARSCAPTVR